MAAKYQYVYNSISGADGHAMAANLVGGQAVTATDTTIGVVIASRVWSLEDVPATSSVPRGTGSLGSGASCSFTPDVVGDYLLRLTLNGSLISRKVFRVNGPNGFVSPAFDSDQFSTDFAGTNAFGNRPNFDAIVASINGLVASSGYNTVDNQGVALTARTVLNFGAGLLAADNAGAARTDVTLAATLGAQTFAVTDTATAAITDVITQQHKLSSGTAAPGIGAGSLWQAPNAAGSLVNVTEYAGALSVATGGAEKSYARIRALNGSGVLADALYAWGMGKIGIGTGTTEPAGLLEIDQPASSAGPSELVLNRTNVTTDTYPMIAFERSGFRIGYIGINDTDNTLTLSGALRISAGGVVAQAAITGVFGAILNAPSTIYVGDGTSGGISVPLTLQHNASGGAVAGIGTGLLFQTKNSAAALISAAQHSGVLSAVTAGAESGYHLFTAASAGTLVEVARLDPVNGVTLGVSGGKLGFLGSAAAAKPAAYTTNGNSGARSLPAIVTLTAVGQVLGQLLLDLNAYGLVSAS